jgi:hypothetical protein
MLYRLTFLFVGLWCFFGFVQVNFYASQMPSFLFNVVSEPSESVFRWARVQENQDYFIPVLVAFLLIIFFVRRYRIDAIVLKRWQRFLLIA